MKTQASSALVLLAPSQRTTLTEWTTIRLVALGSSYVDIEGVYRTEYELIRRYREMALYPEVDSAIEDIVNEAIVSDVYESPVQVELSNVDASEKVKGIIRSEFKYIKELLDFDKRSHEIFRNWYIDGRLHYLKVIDFEKPQDGIMDLRYIDPMKVKFVRKLNDKAATDARARTSLTLNNTGGRIPNARNDQFSRVWMNITYIHQALIVQLVTVEHHSHQTLQQMVLLKLLRTLLHIATLD